MLLPLILWGAIGTLAWVSRKASAPPPPVTQTGAVWDHLNTIAHQASMPASPMAEQAVLAAMGGEHTGHRGHRGGYGGYGWPGWAFATSPTDARPMMMAGHGGGGHGGGGHGGPGGGGRNWGGRWSGGWWGPGWWDDGYGPQIVGPSLVTPVPVPVPAVSGDVATVCQWALTSADSKTLRALISKYASNPAAVSCLSQRLAQVEALGF